MPETNPAIEPPLLPGRARLVDLAATALVAGALWIAIVGGARYLVRGVVIPFNSPLVLVYIAVSILIVRHVLWPRPSAWTRVKAAYAAVLAREDMAAALRAFIATRPAVFLVGFFAVVTIGLSSKAGFVLSPSPLANLPARFDAGWYGDIARGGYGWDHTFERQRNIAFFPAMPMLMRPVGTLFGMRDSTATRERRMLRALWAGVVISLGAFLWGLHYFVRFGRDLIGAERAGNAALLLAAYPFAVFFNAPYTESLFLLAAVGACYHFRRGEWAASSCWGLIAGLTRPNGCFVSVPLGILALQEIYSRIKAGQAWDRAAYRTAGLRLLTAAMPGFGMLAFTAYLYGLTGVWFAWARSHQAWGRSFHGIAPFVTAYGWLRDEPLLEVVANIPFNSLNALGVLFGLALTYTVFRRLGLAWGVFVLVNLVPPLFAGGVLSMGRVSSTLFPLFLALAILVPTRAVPAWVAGFGIGQGLCAALFFTWRELF
ncbi:MAG: mannosyltransferase family protein [Acidobacteriota bacterium]